MSKEEIKIRDSLIEAIEYEYDDEKVYKDCHQLLLLGKKWKDDKAIGAAYYFIARTNMRQGRFQSALENLQVAVPYLKKSQDIERYIRAYNMRGVAYSELGNESIAMECYLDGIECAKRNNSYDLLVLFYNNIGSKFQEVGEHKEALQYLYKAKKYMNKSKGEKKGPSYVDLVVCLNLGISYMYFNEYEKAEKALEAAQKIIQENNDGNYQFTLSCLFAKLYWKTERKELTYPYLDELIAVALERKYLVDYTQDMAELIELLDDMKDYKRLELLIDSYEEYAKKQNVIHLYMNAVEYKLSYYEMIGNTEKYQEYAILYTKLSIEQKKKQLGEQALSMKLKIDLKETEIEQKNAQKREERLKRRSELDALTGLGNRYSLERYSGQLMRKALKEQIKIGIGIMDIDCFKEYNDTYGHMAGDKCLAKVASILEEKTEGRGRCFRYGGDEFVILIGAITEQELIQIADEIRCELGKKKLEHRKSTVKDVVTMSQGYACMKLEKVLQLSEILEYADAALYRVKEDGKDGYRVVSIEESL